MSHLSGEGKSLGNEEPESDKTAAGWTNGVSVLKAGTSVPRPELISSPCIASFIDGEAIQVSPSPAILRG